MSPWAYVSSSIPSLTSMRFASAQVRIYSLNGCSAQARGFAAFKIDPAFKDLTADELIDTCVLARGFMTCCHSPLVLKVAYATISLNSRH